MSARPSTAQAKDISWFALSAVELTATSQRYLRALQLVKPKSQPTSERKAPPSRVR